MFYEISGKPLGDGKPMTHTVLIIKIEIIIHTVFKKNQVSFIYLFIFLKCEISELAVDHIGPPNDRKLAFVDKNRDLYVTSVRVIGNSRKINKLGTNIHNFVWNDTYNMLAGIADSRFTIWYYPAIVFVDKYLLPKTLYQRDAVEFGV